MLLGRRGPAQAAFTNPELRELGELKRADLAVEPTTWSSTPPASAGWPRRRDATAQRNVDILRDYAERGHRGTRTASTLRFLRSPIEIVGEGEDGPVTGVRVVVNAIEPDATAACAPSPTGEEEVIECGLVLRSIGYRGRPFDGVPFDERRGLIRNEGGRVIDDDGEPRAAASTSSAGSSAARRA